MKKRFLALWDSRHFTMSGYKYLDYSSFNEENGYNREPQRYLDELEVNEIIQLSIGHYVMRIS